MIWDRIQSELERARRDLLSRTFGPGPHTAEIAHHQIQAVLLRRAARAFEDEARRLAQDGLSPQAVSARQQVRRLTEQAEAEDASAARLEADQLHAEDPQRYAALRLEIQRLSREVAARDLGNEIIQAAARLGPRAAESLWRELFRRTTIKEIKAPADLEPRFREMIGVAQQVRDAAARRPAGEERLTPVGELVLEADRLVDEAALLSREDLYDRIVILAGQLKQWQELGPSQLSEQERTLLRQGFGTLTRLSKIRQPGWTQTLDSRVTGSDWAGSVSAARQRLAERAFERRRTRELARREQVSEALRDLHESERRIVFQEAIERLRARVYELDGMRERTTDEDELAWLRREARTQAAIACRAADSDDDRLDRISQTVRGHEELAGEGRPFRSLRRYWGLEVPEETTVPAGAAQDDIDEEELDFTAGDLDDAAWPPEILHARGAGAGERVLLVGGIPNLERRRLLREFFGWREVEWVESYRDHSADFRTLRNQIRSGRVDRVIVLARFCGHDVTQGLSEVTRRNNVRFHVHPRGASIPAIAGVIYSAALTTASPTPTA